MQDWRAFYALVATEELMHLPKPVQKMVSAQMGVAVERIWPKRNAARLRRATGPSLMSGNSFSGGVSVRQA